MDACTGEAVAGLAGAAGAWPRDDAGAAGALVDDRPGGLPRAAFGRQHGCVPLAITTGEKHVAQAATLLATSTLLRLQNWQYEKRLLAVRQQLRPFQEHSGSAPNSADIVWLTVFSDGAPVAWPPEEDSSHGQGQQ
jgi:hypothetical protein